MRDADVRSAVMKRLRAIHAAEPATRIVEEMGVWSGSVRIDIAVINGELSGYELKSDRDTLDRLAQQADLYGRVFDRLTLVTGPLHSAKAIAKVPLWWAVTVAYEAANGLQLEPIRTGSLNPDPHPYFLAQLLWRPEAVAALERFNLAKGWRSKPVRSIHERLAAEVPYLTLAEHVRGVLKGRPGWLGQPVGDEGQMTTGDV